MHIRPIPLGLAILGFGLLVGKANETVSWWFRHPETITSWRRDLRSLFIWWAVGAVCLVAGIVGLLV